MAFRIANGISYETLHDPRYVKWYARAEFRPNLDREDYVYKYIPLQECTDKDWE